MTLHVGNKVKILSNSNTKIYTISDISFDTADDGTPLPMYNLYNEDMNNILEEPFYENELQLIER